MEQVIFRDHTGSHPVVVTDKGRLRSLRFGSDERQSTIDLDRPDILQLAYTKWMMTSLLLHPAPERFLLLGLGGGSIARFLLRHHPAAQIDAVEKEAAVIKLARSYFLLPDSKNLRIFQQDAVDFLVTAPSSTTYHLAFVDLFGPGSMAAPLFVTEFYQTLLDRLTADGILAINMWSGRKTHFQRARRALLTACEGRVLQMQVKKRSNIILLGFPEQVPKKQLRRAKKNLPAYQQRYQLDFPAYIRRLRRSNRHFLNSLIPGIS